MKDPNQDKKERKERRAVKSFVDEYDKKNPICDGTKCDVIRSCVMNPWREKQSGFVETEERKKIIQGLAEITVRANQKIARLFKSVNNGQLPKKPPVFKLVLTDCSSHKPIPIDFGD